MITAYLIGGPADLTKVALTKASPIYRVPVFHDSLLANCATKPPLDSKIEIARYLRMASVGRNVEIYVYEPEPQ